MNFDIPDVLFAVINDPTLSIEQKVERVNNFAVPVVDMNGEPVKSMPPILTKEQAGIITNAIENHLFDNPGKTAASITCNKCGRQDTHVDEAVSFADVTDNPEHTIRIAKANFRKMGWLTTWGFDVCPKCAEEMNE